ncbi:MAG: hypothetical protein IKK34_00100 [Clostridia bacterium]|nr:hypothetical protein [Clostridia bacterium]
MKRLLLISLLIWCFALPHCAYAENEDSFLDSAGKFFGDAWNSAGELWNEASNAAGEAWDAAGNKIGQAWTDFSGAASDAWNKAGTYLSEKGDQFSVWMSINGKDALEKLKGIYDDMAAEIQISSAAANKLWLQSMDHAEANDIAKVTQAKLTLALLAYAQANTTEGNIADVALDMLLNSGIENQTAAENVLASLLAVSGSLPAEPDPNEPRYYMGDVVNTGKDNGYSESHKIDSKDPHFGWKLGSFFVSGYTSVHKDENGDPIFIKTLGDQVELWFHLEQDIDCLNGNDALSISEDGNGFDEAFGISTTNFGRGAMITQHIDYRNAVGTPQLYTDYLSGITASGADTTVQLFEEGDYKVALNYEIKDESMKVIDSYSNYRITFRFSVRNGNCMVYPFDVVTGAELTNTAITSNGFYLDLARSRYLDINIKREVLAEGAVGLTEDVRFNRPARDGDQYTDEGIYTITVSNRYTGQETTKQIYVGTNKILMAHMVTGLSVEEVREQIAKGAQIAEDGTIIGMVTD